MCLLMLDSLAIAQTYLFSSFLMIRNGICAAERRLAWVRGGGITLFQHQMTMVVVVAVWQSLVIAVRCIIGDIVDYRRGTGVMVLCVLPWICCWATGDAAAAAAVDAGAASCRAD